MSRKLDAISVEILWARLLGMVDQAAVALMRTAFSGVVRDSHDFACVLCDDTGAMVAQDSRGTPGLAGPMPFVMRNFLAAFPPETLHEGDILLTNDPWMATGHLLDLTIATPIFFHGRLQGFALCCAHQIDIGGRKATLESREVYEEGLNIPFCKFHERGIENDLVLRFLRANVRVPDMVIGDLRAQVTANALLAESVRELLADEDLPDLHALRDEIVGRTEAATRAAIVRVPDGRYEATTWIDRRYDRNGKLTEPIRLQCALIVTGDRLTIDFEGSSPQVEAAINATPVGLMQAYTLFGIKSLLDPELPNNEGFVRCIDVVAPAGSILGATFPASVTGRNAVVHFIPEMIYEALAQVMPERVIAGCGSVPSWAESFSGKRHDGTAFAHYLFLRGGMGGRPHSDGVSCISFPSNSANLPVEVFEAEAPALVEKKELMVDSAGPGEYRGGLGQEISIRILGGALGPAGPVVCGVRGGRLDYDVPGILGGSPAPRAEFVFNGENIRAGRQLLLQPDDRIVFRVPGGGGYGPVARRDPERVKEDVRLGYISPAAARERYGVAPD